MLTEGLSFPEAVERLAEEAGVAMPEAPARDEAERRRARSAFMPLLEAAAASSRRSLRAAPAPMRRRYLERRGLTAGGHRPLPPGLRAQQPLGAAATIWPRPASRPAGNGARRHADHR